MAIERSWERIGPLAFTADGGADGVVTVNSVECFKVKQKVKLASATQPNLSLEIKKVLSYTQLVVGPVRDKTHPGKPKHNILSRTDISAYTVADGATITSAEQPKSGPSNTVDIFKAVYEQEPTVALRNVLVDKIGVPISSANPLPIDGNISVTLETTPNNQSVQNIVVVNANTEFTINLPDNTKRYFIRVRNNVAKGRIAFAPTETATKYWTLSRGTIFDSDSLNLPINSNIYMQVDKDNVTVEVLSLKKQ